MDENAAGDSRDPGPPNGDDSRPADPSETTVLPRVAAPLARTPSSNQQSEAPPRYNDTLYVDSADPWAWVAATETAEVIDISHCRVTAVLVTQNAERWLPETLTALAGLTRRPDRVIAVDNESTDASLALLDDAVQRREIDAVYLGQHGFGFGDAIRSALAQDSGARATDPDHPAEHDWLWLLHDDAAPAPDALAQLLGHVVTDTGIDITGPKLLRPRRRNRPYQISEVGVSISRSGRRHLGLESGEIDQGQRDQPVRRLSVSSCGMLMRRTLWDTLGGFDPAVPGFRDGVEFGWRAQLAGYRVLTTPAAMVVHRQVGRAGLRPSGVGGARPARTDREFGMTLIAAHASAAALPFVWIRLVLGSLLRAVGYLFGKVPGRSVDELSAAWSFIRHPGRIRRIRRRARGLPTTAKGDAAVQRLLPSRGQSVKAVIDLVGTAIGNRYVAIAGSEPDAATLDELTSDDQSSVAEEKKRNPWLSPIVIAAVLSVICCLIAARELIGLGSLRSPYLLPIGGVGELWRSFVQPIPGAELTTQAPWVGLVAAASTLFVGQPEWLLTVLVIGAVPLALLSVYPLLRQTVDDRRVRLWAAVSYALLPVLLGGSNQGRLVLIVAAVVLPLLAMAGRALVLRRPGYPEAWRGAWGVGLVLTVLGAFVPSLILVAAVLAVVAGCTIARQPRKIGRLVIAIGVPVVILSPWWPTVFANWGRLLTGPDPALDGAGQVADAWMYLIGRDGGPGLPPLWLGAIVFGAIWLLALTGLFRSRRRPVLAGWLIGLICFAVAIGLSRFLVPVSPNGLEARPYVGVYLLIAFGALVLAAAIGLDGYTQDLERQDFSFAQPASVLAAVLAAAICLLGTGWWIVGGSTGPIERTQMAALPPYIQDAQTGPKAVRTLAVELSGNSAGYSVIEGDQVRLGDPERGYAFGGSEQARDQVESVVDRLLSGTGDADLAADLADLGVNYVWISGADDDLSSRISNTAGLATASGSQTAEVWQLTQPTSRARLVSGEQVTRLDNHSGVQVPDSSLQRVLRLGVPTDPRWEVTLDGRPLEPVDDGSWQASFEVPQSGGELEFRLASVLPWLPIGQGVALALVAVLAAPAVRRLEIRDPMRDARRAATGSSGDQIEWDTYVGRYLGTVDASELTSHTGLNTISGGLTTSTGGSADEELLPVPSAEADLDADDIDDTDPDGSEPNGGDREVPA